MGRSSGGGGRIGRVRIQGSYVTVANSGISTKLDVGGARLIAGTNQRDRVALLKRFPRSTLQKTLTSYRRMPSFSGNTQSAINAINAALGKR